MEPYVIRIAGLWQLGHAHEAAMRAALDDEAQDMIDAMSDEEFYYTQGIRRYILGEGEQMDAESEAMFEALPRIPGFDGALDIWNDVQPGDHGNLGTLRDVPPGERY